MDKIHFAFIPGTDSIRIYKEGVCVSTLSTYNKETNSLTINRGKIREFYHIEQALIKELKKLDPPMLGFIHKGNRNGIIAIPTEMDEPAIRAFRDLLEMTGFKNAYMVFDTLINAIGMEIDPKSTYTIVDSGAGKTRINTIKNGDYKDITTYTVTTAGGNSMNDAIRAGISRDFNLHISLETAEALKREYGSLVADAPVRYAAVKGQDKITQRPSEITLPTDQLSNYLREEAEVIRRMIAQHYELLPQEIKNETSKTGLYLAGKVFRLRGLIEWISEVVPVAALSYSINKDYIEEGMIRIQNNPQEYEYWMLK